MTAETVNALSLNDTVTLTFNNLVNSLAAFLPRLLLAFLVLLLGILLAGWVKSLIKSLLQAIHLSKMVANSPVERFFVQGEVPIQVEEVAGGIGKLVVIYLFFTGACSIVGLNAVAQFLSSLLNYIPRLLSAIIIFLLGVLGAGLVETFVKGGLSGIDIAASRLAGKAASYMVVGIATLAAISELGIAQFFIDALFIGMVAMFSLGVGLAVGLGAKDTVSEMLKRWYRKGQA